MNNAVDPCYIWTISDIFNPNHNVIFRTFLASSLYYQSSKQITQVYLSVIIKWFLFNIDWVIDECHDIHIQELFFTHNSKWQDKVTGDWCLTITTLNGVENIGYWPKSMFNSLGDYASRIQWGGLVYSPTSEPSPPMGNGKFPSNGGARVIEINMINENGQTLEPQGDELLYADKPDCYATSKLSNNKVAGWFFRFGGPGGCIG